MGRGRGDKLVMVSEMYAAERWTVPKLPWRGGCWWSCGTGFEGGGRKERGVLIVVGRGSGNGRHSEGRGRREAGNGDIMDSRRKMTTQNVSGRHPAMGDRPSPLGDHSIIRIVIG